MLVANRGEIAVRVIRACRELGLRTVAIYSEADAHAPHVELADEAYPVGPAPARRSYLHIPSIMNVVTQSGADMVHPGYGFLSENAAFSSVCRLWGVQFVGPQPEAIERMGVKAQAKETMREASVPVVPGSDGVVQSLAEAEAVAERIGYPLLVKASAGGGGRGIRIVQGPSELATALERAASEAQSSFGDGSLYIEKYLVDPRHIEIQVIADRHGRVAAIGERESSLQRRRQKLVEEAPSTALDEDLRLRMEEAARQAALAVSYENAGTIEFLLDQSGEFYFMEMNTRIQVEHGVSELVTGIDLVKEQLLVAMGEHLNVPSDYMQPVGHAIECRINAEDPSQDFRPSPGTIERFEPPGGFGVRADFGVQTGSQVTAYYDSMIGKLMTWGRTRPEAIARMRRALLETRVEGIKTTIPLHLAILDDPDFCAGKIDINFLERRLAEGLIAKA